MKEWALQNPFATFVIVIFAIAVTGSVLEAFAAAIGRRTDHKSGLAQESQ